MANFVLTNAYLSVNAVDLSAKIISISVPQETAMVPNATMGVTTQASLPGLLHWTIEAELAQDFAAGQTDATISPLWGAAAFTIETRPVNAAVSATNPKWSGSAVVASYTPIAGAVGDRAVARVTFESAGALTRAVA